MSDSWLLYVYPERNRYNLHNNHLYVFEKYLKELNTVKHTNEERLTIKNI